MAAEVPKIKNVATVSDAVQGMQAYWGMILALLAGTTAMRTAKAAYLPKQKLESDEAYNRRVGVATLFPAYKRTVETLAAKPFSKPITVNKDVPEKIKALLTDIDLEGRNIDQMAGDLMVIALGPGFGGILVDYKKAPVLAPNADGTPQRALTEAEEITAGLRSYFTQINPQQMIGWKAETANGEHQLTMVRFREYVEEPDGEFNTSCVEQIRVLEIGKWRTYRKKVTLVTGLEEWILHEEGTQLMAGKPATFIPFIPIYGDRIGFMLAKPPLLELAHLNVKHWQSQSDQDTLLSVARVPILTAIGIEDDPDKPFKLAIGVSGAVMLPLGAALEYTEHTGKAIEAGKTSLDDLKEDMRQSGAELLVINPTPTTATEVASDNAVGMCALQKITLTLQDSLNLALEYLGQWEGLGEGAGGTLKLFNDFGAATLAEASAQLLVSMSAMAKLSTQTLYSELKRRAILGPDVEWDKEKELIDGEGPPLIPAPAIPPQGARKVPPQAMQ